MPEGREATPVEAERIACHGTSGPHDYRCKAGREATPDHAPIPGPQYWDWRCLVCSEPVADHPSWWSRLRSRLSPPARDTT